MTDHFNMADVAVHVAVVESESSKSLSDRLRVYTKSSHPETKGHIVDDDSTSEDSEPRGHGAEAHQNGRLALRHLASMAKHDEEVVGSPSPMARQLTRDAEEEDINESYVDVDGLARRHKETGGALSSPNDRRFMREVNEKVRAEQKAMDDIFQDMDGDGHDAEFPVMQLRLNPKHRKGERSSFLVDHGVDESGNEGQYDEDVDVVDDHLREYIESPR